MALSRRSTTLAVLRGILGSRHGQEARFAGLVGRSVSWVKKVSAGHEPLTGDVALQLERSTGIAAAWLLNGDPAIPPVDITGRTYTLNSFEHHRSGLEAREMPSIAPGYLQLITGIATAAARRGRASLFHYRLSRFLEECREEFGFVQDTPSVRAAPPREAKKIAEIPEPETEEPELGVHLL